SLKYKTPEDFYLNVMTALDDSWLDTDVNYQAVEETKYLFHDCKSILEKVSDFDQKTYLNWDINTKVDRASMAFSLEARAPLLDHRVVDFANSLPLEFKFNGKNQKRILKDVLYDKVPKSIFDRPKSGFTMPFSRWFKEDLKDFVMEELNESSLNGLPCINPKVVKTMINQHMKGTWNKYPLIWKLLVLKQWLDNNGKGLSIR
ncbi:MAG: asparagine synthase, partial [Psychroserpens sp.]|nr:asparagine synthase [Psychroserpens sp.]